MSKTVKIHVVVRNSTSNLSLLRTLMNFNPDERLKTKKMGFVTYLHSKRLSRVDREHLLCWM